MPNVRIRALTSDGFTVVELLLVFALTIVLAAISIPVYQNFQVRNDLDVVTTTVAQSMRRAQLLAQAGEGDSSWGLSVDDADNNLIVVFKGDSYRERDQDFDETFDLPRSITASGVTEVVFSKMAGEPSAVGVTTLTSSTSETREVSINEKGTVSY